MISYCQMLMIYIRIIFSSSLTQTGMSWKPQLPQFTYLSLELKGGKKHSNYETTILGFYFLSLDEKNRRNKALGLQNIKWKQKEKVGI